MEERCTFVLQHWHASLSYRMVHSVEHFSNVADLGDNQEERLVEPNVAMEIFILRQNSNASLVRGFGTRSKELSNETVFGVTSVGDLDLSNTEVAIVFPDEVLDIAQSLEGILTSFKLW